MRYVMRRLIELARERREGVAAVEFALIVPVIALMVFGIIVFGMAFSNYVDLTEGTRVAARVLAQASAYPSQAYSSAQSYFAAATTNLNQANLTMAVSVNGSACTGTACNTALAAAPGNAVTVTATYTECIEVMGVNFLPSCQLSATTTQMIE
jgi:Flp pilus assembly protein TadG